MVDKIIYDPWFSVAPDQQVIHQHCRIWHERVSVRFFTFHIITDSKEIEKTYRMIEIIVT